VSHADPRAAAAHALEVDLIRTKIDPPGAWLRGKVS